MLLVLLGPEIGETMTYTTKKKKKHGELFLKSARAKQKT